MSQPQRFEPGLTLIQQRNCPRRQTNPLACWTCPYGHATECHYPLDCEEAECGHYQARES